MKGLTKEEQEAKLKPFREASEQEGLKLLTDDERKKLEQLSQERTAGGSRGGSLIAQRQGPGSDGGRDRRGSFGGRGGRGDFRFGGGGGDNNNGNRPSFGERRGESGGSNASGTPVNKDLPVEKQPIVAAGEGRLRFNSHNQPWRDVIEWFAAQADLSLVMEFSPPGTFNYYQDSTSYTPVEALDKLNYVLNTKGFALIKHDKMLMLVDLQNPLPSGLVPTIPVEELDKHGQYEFVNVLFKLNRLTPEEAQSEIEKLRGPGTQSSVAILPKTRQLSVTDTAGRLITIKKVLDTIENPDANAAENLQPIAVWSMKAEDALKVVKELLNIPIDRSNTADGSLRIVADSAGHRLLVAGKQDAIKRVADILKAIDAGHSGNAPVSTPQLEVYSLSGVDSATVLQVLQTLLAPDAAQVRLSVDPSGRLIAYAPPEIQNTIQATIRQMQQDARQIVVMKLRLVDPQQAVLSINKLFAGADGTNKTGPKVEAETQHSLADCLRLARRN